MSNFDIKIVKSLELLEGFATLGKNMKGCRTLSVYGENLSTPEVTN